jgi:hypothetical protein
VNFCCPTFKLKEKKRAGSKYVKKYDSLGRLMPVFWKRQKSVRRRSKKFRAIRAGLDRLSSASASSRSCGGFELQKSLSERGLAARSGYVLTREPVL